MNYSLRWDLDVFFQGGSHSEEFAAHLSGVEQDLSEFKKLINSWNVTSEPTDKDVIIHILEQFALVGAKLRQAGAFISCLEAQDTTDTRAREHRGKVTGFSAEFSSALNAFDVKLAQLEEQFFQAILKDNDLKEVRFVLEERRERVMEKLSVEEESLINQLSVDGYHGWGQMYDVLVSSVKIPVQDQGELKQLSVGQASNKFSDPDRKVREDLFRNWEKAWGEKADLFANTLNHLSGFRLSVYGRRGWDDVLKEPLDINRMSKETLHSMWSAIAEQKGPLKQYLNRKAELLGVKKLSWFDLDAPVTQSAGVMPYQEGAEFILNQFSKFGKELTRFTEKAFKDSWIEAEDRDNKSPGGFCTGFPESGQSRIFMTYSGTPSNVSTLAHELGHAFHSYVLKESHYLNRGYAMNVAETASTFAELIVSDAAVKEAKNEDEKLALLEDKVQRSVALLMNIHARFIFETNYYEERKQGVVGASRLNELMEEAQKEAYGDALEEYHPLFWASKLHFFITGVPFYNFPYTFGYLFSLGIYKKAIEEGESFEQKYIKLLQDTGSMKVEELAMKHLGADLTKRDFWDEAVSMCMKDVEEFLELTKVKVQ
ncbi:pepF/M3 family oligoendopeptidase [Peribacillus deserti]|uniref:PepF/M3 family oligoendopeptidase n=1 Tax=Peribacillus deserti TaxID=673318 RepID=A0ABS2QFB2_9BACI|nr:M3 family oligoendopeptidase [Peribacillus deserti]MBM7691846.1 pepF/M3 family oligoendopeptidase [Peribacillus deserti]